jgi:hypothetical protein
VSRSIIIMMAPVLNTGLWLGMFLSNRQILGLMLAVLGAQCMIFFWPKKLAK